MFVCLCIISKLTPAKFALETKQIQTSEKQPTAPPSIASPNQRKRRCRRYKNHSAACTHRSLTLPHQHGQHQHLEQFVSAVFENAPNLLLPSLTRQPQAQLPPSSLVTDAASQKESSLLQTGGSFPKRNGSQNSTIDERGYVVRSWSKRRTERHRL